MVCTQSACTFHGSGVSHALPLLPDSYFEMIGRTLLASRKSTVFSRPSMVSPEFCIQASPPNHQLTFTLIAASRYLEVRIPRRVCRCALLVTQELGVCKKRTEARFYFDVLWSKVVPRPIPSHPVSAPPYRLVTFFFFSCFPEHAWGKKIKKKCLSI